MAERLKHVSLLQLDDDFTSRFVQLAKHVCDADEKNSDLSQLLVNGEISVAK